MTLLNTTSYITTIATDTETAANKELAVKAQTELLLEKDFTAFDRYWAEPYLQHNPILPSGVAAIRTFKETFLPGCTVEIVRVVADGDIVAFHQHVTGYERIPDQVDIDIYRVADGKLVEHWDAMMDGAGIGTSMLAGPTEIVDRDRTTANRALVTDLVERVLVPAEVDDLDTYVHADLIQHDPTIEAGLVGLAAQVSDSTTAYTALRMVVAEGNLVVTGSEATTAGRDIGIFDVWRVEDGKVVEQWRIQQDNPTETASGLRMF